MNKLLSNLLLVALLSSFSYAADRALIVGVERYKNLPKDNWTPGCEADARAMEQFMRSAYGFTEVKVLLNEEATAANIQHWFRTWLIEGTKPGERAFFFYAGHGSQLKDDNGDEKNDNADETIAPYDVNALTGANQIRDDVFDQFIAQLSGRRAVLVFDSCHSGTISRGVPKLKEFASGGGARYLPSAEQIAALKAAGTRGDEGESYIVQKPSGSRDLVLEGDFIEPERFSKTSGIVIISAAGDRQQAFPILVNRQYRGAFTAAFIEAHQGGKPKLQELQRAVTSRILRQQQLGELDGNQQPVFTTIAPIPLGDQPLFASWEAAPMIALVNPLSTIRLSLRTRESKTAYRVGEKIAYQVETNAQGYLYVVVFSQQNVASCIFPNSEDLNNEVANGALTVPRSTTYEFPIEEPLGRDVVVALLSKQKLNLGDKVRYTWDEIFARLKLDALQQEVKKSAMRGVGVEKTNASLGAGDWQGAFLVLETLPK